MCYYLNVQFQGQRVNIDVDKCVMVAAYIIPLSSVMSEIIGLATLAYNAQTDQFY